MKVNNVNGTSERTCRCGSWLDHWKKFSNQSGFTYCAVDGCNKKSDVGAHVQKDSLYDKKWYIIPFCREHNGETGKSLTIIDTLVLVPANVSETCG